MNGTQALALYVRTFPCIGGPAAGTQLGGET